MKNPTTSSRARHEQFAAMTMSMTAGSALDVRDVCACDETGACACSTTAGVVAAVGPDGDVPVPEPTADETPGEPIATEAIEEDDHPFVAYLAPLDVWSSDGRRLLESGASWRDPQTNTPALMCQTMTSDGHDGASFVATFTRFWVEAGWLMGAGMFDPEGWAAYEAERLVRDGRMQGVSVDLAVWDADWEYDDETERGFMTATAWECLGATIVPFPAFADAHIECVGTDDPRLVVAAAADVPPLAASAAPPADLRPPAHLFARRTFDGPTPLTWTRDPSGWWSVAGHIAAWGTPHTGGISRTPPRSASGYAYYATGEIDLDDGTTVNVGTLTMGCGHAGLELTPAATASHYDHSGATVAWFAPWEDEHGIAVAGCAPFDIPDAAVQLARTVVPSGDWRPIRGSLELMAVLLVGTPGFPVVRATAAVRAGRQTALVAAGVLDPATTGEWPPPAVRRALVAAAHREATIRADAAVAG